MNFIEKKNGRIYFNLNHKQNKRQFAERVYLFCILAMAALLIYAYFTQGVTK